MLVPPTDKRVVYNNKLKFVCNGNRWMAEHFGKETGSAWRELQSEGGWASGSGAAAHWSEGESEEVCGERWAGGFCWEQTCKQGMCSLNLET